MNIPILTDLYRETPKFHFQLVSFNHICLGGKYLKSILREMKTYNLGKQT